MHMADALISPAVGGVMLTAAAGVAAFSIKKIKNELDETKIPLMGVMGAFVFAAQMINFTIPGTGSSGHLGGGLLLSAILGPYAGFLTMISILLIQALFFADGGLLAFGCNVINLGFFTCFIAYPYIFKRITAKGKGMGTKRIFAASLISAVVGLQLGAFSVVIQTVLSGKTVLPFTAFVLWMQPIHLAIGIVEGLVSAAVISFIWKMRPEIIESATKGITIKGVHIRKIIIYAVIAVIITGGAISWFASSNPDGLEWAMLKTAGTDELEAYGSIYDKASDIQNKTAILPDYDLKNENGTIEKADDETNADADEGSQNENGWPAVNTGTSIAGLIGGGMTFALLLAAGFAIAIIKKRKKKAAV